MMEYKIHQYDSKKVEEIAKVSSKVAENWVWPYQHSPEAIKNLSSKSDFDPNLLLYCTKDEQIIGYILADIGSKFLGSNLSVNKEYFARVIFPAVLPGHEQAADLLLDKILDTLKNRGIKLIRIRTSTMNSGSIDFLKQRGFIESAVFPYGYKLYYQYNSNKGKIDYPVSDIQLFDEQRDIEGCTKWVADFFHFPESEAKNHILQKNAQEDLVSHLVIRVDGKLAGYCFANPNSNVPKIHATFYIEAKNEDYFKQLLTQSINNSIDSKSETFIVDLIYSVLKYEEAVKSLGLEKVATWGVYEKQL